MNNNIYIIWIWGIGISAIARYYNNLGYTVYWNDVVHSELTKQLEIEWITLCSFEDAENKWDISILIYSEWVPQDHNELLLAKEKEIPTQSYPQALAAIANDKKLIAIAGTHGKSTTTSLTALVLKNSEENFSAVVWTLLKEFDNKNFYHRPPTVISPLVNGIRENWATEDSHFFVIEACEYKRSFLNYKPTVWVIVNIELDHLDYFKNEADYLNAFQGFISNIRPWGFAILNGDDPNCQKMVWVRDDIQYIEVFDDYFSFNEKVLYYPDIELQIAGNHVLFDAKIAYIIWHMLWIPSETLVWALEAYTGVWRRMEHVKNTHNGNMLISDYGHHPTEVQLTLDALKQKYPDKHLYTIFQPHQYNRTLELIEEFKNCFSSADTLIIPNIYESRDNEEDKKNMPVEKFVSSISHPNIRYGEGLENTLKLIQEYDLQNPGNSIILLLWAGNVDNLRYEIT